MERKLREDDFTLRGFSRSAAADSQNGLARATDGHAAEDRPLRENSERRVQVDEGRLKSIEAIINSMTAAERTDHNVIDGKRRKRIATRQRHLGAGRERSAQAICRHAPNDEAIRQLWPKWACAASAN